MLPQRQTLTDMQTTWATALNPIIANPIVNGNLLKNLKLVAGKNVINHKLGRDLQGWEPTRIRAAATFYDDQDNNQTPALTLVIYASADVTIDLLVF